MRGGPYQEQEIPGSNRPNYADQIGGTLPANRPMMSFPGPQTIGIPSPDFGLPPLMSNDRAVLDPQPLQRGTAEAILKSGMTPSEQAPGSMPGSSLSPSSLPGQAPGGGGSGFKLGFGPEGSRLSNQDFNPAGYRPNESRSTAIGKYGGSPLYAATLGAPFSVLDDRMNAIAKREHELDKAIKDFDPTKDLANPNAVKYRDTLNEWGMGAIENYVNNVTAAYGEEKGMQRLMTGGTKEAMGLRRLTKHLNTVIANVDDAVARSQAIVVGMNDGTLQYNDRLYNMAEEVEKRLGEYEQNNDPEELAQMLPRFNANVSLVDQLTKDGVVDMITKAGSTQKIFEMVKSGDPLYAARFSTLLSKKTIDRSAIVDTLTDQYARQYQKDMSRDEVRQMIDSMTPQLYEEDVERSPIPKSTASSIGTSSDKPVGASLGDPTVIPENTIRVGTGKPLTGSKPNDYRPTVDLMTVVSDQGALSKPYVFRDGNKDVTMHALRIMNIDGELFLIGKKTGLPRSSDPNSGNSVMEAMIALEYMKGGGQMTKDQEKRYKEFLDMPSVAVPFSENEKLIGKVFNVDTESVKQELGYLGPNTEEGPNKPVVVKEQQKAILQRLGVSQAAWNQLTPEEQQRIIAAQAKIGK